MRKLAYILTPLLVVGLIVIFPRSAFATTDTFTSSGTWVAPAGVTSVTADVWAAGGGGNKGSSGGNTGDGAGGGAFSEKVNITVVPGNSYPVTVGIGGLGGIIFGIASTDGGDSMFFSSTTVLAKGGITARTGGSSASGFGDTKFSGGNGGAGDGTVHGGGGGGGAGTTGNGGNSTLFTGGTGTSVGGGNGGNEDQVGSIKGGGGGGGSSASNGQNGARGEVQLIYTAATPVLGPSRVTIKSPVILKYMFVK